MFQNKKIVVVMPAYNAGKTLERTYKDIPPEIVDCVLLVDDDSNDETVVTANRLGIQTLIHNQNLGYGANQKTCYREALKLGADIIVMLHPDYQYNPRLVPAMISMLSSGVYDVCLGSRIIGNTAIRGGMPIYKYIANRFLTFIQNLLLGQKLSEYHTGYRAFTKDVFKKIPLLANSDDFVFDNQMLTQIIAFGFRVGEISCPAKYFPEASSINFKRSVSYGLGVLFTSILFRMWKWGLIRPMLFGEKDNLKVMQDYYKSAEL